jgi:uncharacterized protein (DUF2384 family)
MKKMTGDVYKDLYLPATRGVKSNDRKKNFRIPLSMIERIKNIANVTRTDDPFNEVRVGNVIRRRRTAIG